MSINNINNLHSQERWCTVCDHNTIHKPLLFKPSGSQFAKVIDVYINSREGWLLDICTNCGVVCVFPMPSENVLEYYYNNSYYKCSFPKDSIGYWMMYKSTGKSKEWIWTRWNNKRLHKLEINNLKRLEKYISNHLKRISFLDVGCGKGEALSAAKDLGWEALGIEISQEAATLAQIRSGVPVLAGQFDAINIESGKFDIIYLREVLEHIREPVKLLRCLNNWLRPGGVLFIQVPNDLLSYRNHLFNKIWWIIPPAHLYCFTPNVLSKVIKDIGLNIVSSGGFADAIGLDIRRTVFWRFGLLDFIEKQKTANNKLVNLLLKLFEVFWDRILFWPIIYLLNHTMLGFTFWITTVKNDNETVNSVHES
jgi:2-polyprenyl-3-methyl-5-hydroxy-6-metoxy-1,4-benzoquinol methylase